MMSNFYSTDIETPFGTKKLIVRGGDLTLIDEPIDIVTFSAYKYSYSPVKKTLICAMWENWGLSAREFAYEPYIDMRKSNDVWLSKETSHPIARRLGCVEFSGSATSEIVKVIQSYFLMLDLALLSGVEMKTIALPLLGTGNQRISDDLVLTPIIRECIEFLKRNPAVEKILICEYAMEKAQKVAEQVSKFYALNKITPAEKTGNNITEKKAKIFISYTAANKDVADMLCNVLENRGMSVWYAPRNVVAHDYATAIVNAITTSSHFVVILSEECMRSQHVLNEIDLAFGELENHITIMPIKIDSSEIAPAFKYYLSRQHWMDAYEPPLEARLQEFADRIEHTVI